MQILLQVPESIKTVYHAKMYEYFLSLNKFKPKSSIKECTEAREAVRNPNNEFNFLIYKENVAVLRFKQYEDEIHIADVMFLKKLKDSERQRILKECLAFLESQLLEDSERQPMSIVIELSRDDHVLTQAVAQCGFVWDDLDDSIVFNWKKDCLGRNGNGRTRNIKQA